MVISQHHKKMQNIKFNYKHTEFKFLGNLLSSAEAFSKKSS